jgi:cell division protein FtsQ
MHQSIDKKSKIAMYLMFLIVLSTTTSKSIRSERLFDKINTIQVTGLSESNNLKIADRLKQSLLKNIFFLNKENVNKILSQYNLVESFSVKKIYPSKIIIDIKQTNFVAKISGTNSFLVGSNGKLIKNESTKKPIPFLFGEFDSVKFLQFKEIIKNSKFKFSDFKSIIFYRYNRWDVLTVDNILIRLPEKNLSESLIIAHEIITDKQFKDIRVVDLRVVNHIITQNE